MKRHWIWLAVSAMVLAVLGWSEYFARQHLAYVIRAESEIIQSNFIQVNTNAEYLVHYTSHGKRLIPNADIIVKNHFISEQDVRITINSHGFRDKELASEKGKTEIRILALGDSITWGDYLPAEQVYVERAEHYLNLNRKGPRIEVINAGIGDTGLEEQVHLLRDSGIQVQPDIVLIGFYLNDSRPPFGFAKEIRSKGWLRQHSVLLDNIYSRFKLWTWYERWGKSTLAWVEPSYKLPWRTDKKSFSALVKLAELDWGAAWQKESWKSIDRHFSEVEALSKKHNFQIAVIGFPVAYQVFPQFLDDTPQRLLKETVDKYGFKFLDTLPLLRSHKSKKLYFDHCHPNPYGNEIIGKELAGFLMREFALNRATPHPTESL